MGRFRSRSTSGGSFKDMSISLHEQEHSGSGISHDAKVAATQLLFHSLLQHPSGGKSCLHFFKENPSLMTALLDRAQQLDEMKESSTLRKDLMLATDVESGYTPLHWGVYQGDLASVLFLLRHALSNPTPRLTHRPMELLENNATSTFLLEAMVTAKDREGYTAGDLLASRQRVELLACRLSLPRPRVLTRDNGRRRRSSFDIEDEDGDEQNQFDLLSKSLRYMQKIQRDEKLATGGNMTEYGCEVLTFGRAHHCALGVGSSSDSSSQQVRPQRVQCFGQSQTGRLSGGVAVAAAAHHTLVATANGDLYSFGLGKGGRLGLGDQITNCPTPLRITGGSLSQRKVVGIAAAENHSIAVTACGYVYTWGSNRFGQLSEDGPSRSTPRRVEDLKSSFCVAVAAGAKHSVALSRQGEVYVWGDNTAGQLGISRRNGTHKVQRVETLWNSSPPKVAIAVEASEQATLVLTVPTGTGLPVNSIFSWGHGSHVPSRVVFDSSNSSRPINPVAISCARYHNVAVSSDGLCYTWGLHADTLGVQQKSKKSSTSMISSPQLVKGMLPENGGGIAVAVSASENHTVVLTETGAMYTWGATHGKDIMGHVGVRWQPQPKRVPGVARAVAVAAAKEHTVYLMGASFPPTLKLSERTQGVNSLEDLAAAQICEYIDLFNVVPLLMVAERADSPALIGYCSEFCRRNLDGVLTVAQRSVLDSYLNEQLSGSVLETNETERDQTYHPILEDIVFAGSERSPLNTIRILCNQEEWVSACEKLSSSELCRRFTKSVTRQHKSFTIARRRSHSLSNVTELASDRCIELTSNMDLSTKELAEQKLILIVKELRGVKKRLSQIEKLEESNGVSLSAEQEQKVARRPQLEADLRLFEPALVKVEKKIKIFSDKVEHKESADKKVAREKKGEEPFPEEEDKGRALHCAVCGITCPDDLSYTMHMNGRKHRNKIAQAKEQEEATVAASIMAERNRQVMLGAQPASPKPPTVAWKKSATSSPKLLRKLPPPPHGTPDTLAPTCPSRKSLVAKPTLKEIMEEESCTKSSLKRLSKKLLSPTGARPSTAVSPFVLPAGSAPPLKSPPWAAPSAKVTVSPVSRSPARTPKHSVDRQSFSLGDFITKPKPASASPKPSAAVWANPPPTYPSASPQTTKNNAVSFTDIQQEELASKETEITTFQTPKGETNKWFIHRRERTGSLLEIQDEANKERENKMFIEEQYRIEKMIAQETTKREKEQAQQLHKNRQKNKKKKAAGEKKAKKVDIGRRQGSSEETRTGPRNKKTSLGENERPARKKPGKGEETCRRKVAGV